jgi:hypothetical protein
MKFKPFTDPDQFDVVGESLITAIVLFSFFIVMEII